MSIGSEGRIVKRSSPDAGVVSDQTRTSTFVPIDRGGQASEQERRGEGEGRMGLTWPSCIHPREKNSERISAERPSFA